MTVIDRHEIKVSKVLGQQLQVMSLNVTLSDTWSPYVQGTMVCQLPFAAMVNLLDPRNNPAPVLEVTLERHFGSNGNSLREWTSRARSGATPIRVSDLTAFGFNKASRNLATHWNATPLPSETLSMLLTIDGLSTNEGEQTLTLEIGGQELRLQDRVAIEPIQLQGATITDWVNDLLTRCGLNPLAIGHQASLAAPLWEPGKSAWDVVSDQLALLDMRLLCDELGRWKVVTRSAQTQTSDARIDDLIEVSRSVDRSDWHDSVAIIWKWQEWSPVTNDIADFSYTELSDSPTWTRPLVEERNAKYPGRFYANVLAAREARKGIKHSYVAPLSLTPRPLQVQAVVDSVGANFATISSVSLSYPAHTMNIETREV